MAERDGWINLYGRDGQLQARYHPPTQTLIIRDRRIDTPHELGRYHRHNLPRERSGQECEAVLG